MADMQDITWTKKQLGEILGEDRGLDDRTASAVAMFGPDDLAELQIRERDAVLQAFAQAARASRDARGPGAAEGGARPSYTPKDLERGLSAARATLEAVPASERSEKAEALLADCHCPVPGG
ncbi:hypothetical protein P1J78_13885 [Psychromarinibacter sp. C21-152]|uniref:Uncharacterized protein n=1 Tax=Psychromarinibacter sediminicola TaxID=3033385 RepID=A0AAE3NWB6_9RHOB|nr:hypothetical protein [Psychromarinibacter sediminicola]MDF0601832.1 hypothetical protein [Psychromarinibacter sediminicola]